MRRETRDVACGEHVVAAADAAAVVDRDAVVGRKPGRSGELVARHDAEPGDDDRPPREPPRSRVVTRNRVAVPLDRRHQLPGPHVHAAPAVVLVQEQCEVPG